MAIAYDASSRGAVAAGTSITFSHTCTGADLALFVGVQYFDDDSSAPTATYNGVSMTLVVEATSTELGSFQRERLFVLVAPATGSNNVVVSFGATVVAGEAQAASYTGVDQTTPTEASGSVSNGAASTSSPACTATVVSSGAWLVGCVQQSLYYTGTITAGAGTTVRQSALACAFADSNGAVSTGAQGLAYSSNTSTAWDGVVVAAVKAAGGGGGSATVSLTGGLTHGTLTKGRLVA